MKTGGSLSAINARARALYKLLPIRCIELTKAMDIQFLWRLFVSTAAIAVVGLLFRLYDVVAAHPRRLRSALRKQGLTGPPPAFLLGNSMLLKKAREAAVSSSPLSHNCGAAVLPFLGQWRKQYGDVFVFALGNTQVVHVTEPEMVREITTCTSLDLGKPTYQAKERGELLGHGILTSNGPHWASQRKIIAPELYMDKVKGMINLIQDSTMALMESWKSVIDSEGGSADIKIDQYMRSFSADVISKACFGSSYSKGEEIFLKLRALQESTSKKVWSQGILCFRHLPTRSNREAWALEREIKRLILNVVKERKEGGFEKDLLQMVLEGAKESELSRDAVDQFIVDNCKNIYLAGYESTAVSASWCLMLLAAYPQWQERIRQEVIDVAKGRVPDSDTTRKMKLLTMTINESLRLYPPVHVISREVLKDMKLGNINFPKGVNLWTVVTTLHTDPDIWGPDSYEFNPERFANGTTGACKFPHLYMPFGVGPRVCLGQNLALIELKILISSMLSRFSFSLSPKYVHSPSIKMIVEPRYGVDLLIKEL